LIYLSVFATLDLLGSGKEARKGASLRFVELVQFSQCKHPSFGMEGAENGRGKDP